jgi:predicted transposase YbfD/YdcC
VLEAKRIFGRLIDPRQEKKVKHNLLDIVMLTIIGVMCGCTDWEEIAMFGRMRLEALKAYLQLSNGIPAHDTLRRVMGMIDPKALETCYWAWVRSILPNIPDDVLSLDGKTIRGSGKPGLKPIHLVSAWSMRAGITLAQVRTSEKSNEITAIPDLLDMLNIAGSVVTIDAMGCQTDIAKKIISKGGDYVLACKENQPTLHEEMTQYFAYADENPDESDLRHERATRRNKSHGRVERRTYELIGACEMLSRFHDFPGAGSIGRVRSHVELSNGTIREDERFYLTSLSGKNALERFARAARKHWGIENSCHWVLDVTFAEDACRTRDEIAAQNLAVARKLALALAKRVPDEIVEKYSHNKAKYTSLNKRLFIAQLVPVFMVEVLLAGA